MGKKEQPGKFIIRTRPELCTGCRLCQLYCSERFLGCFSPRAARIKIEHSGEDCGISFTDDCKDCGVCADYCFYGALEKEPAEPDSDRDSKRAEASP